MCNKLLSSPTGIRLSSSSKSSTFYPMVDWRPVPGITQMAFNMMITGKVGNFNAQPGYQLAAVRPDVPDAPVAVGSMVGTGPYNLVGLSGSSLPDVSAKFFWRFGIFYKSTDGAMASADVGLDVALNTVGRVLGKGVVDVNPFNNNTDTYIWPVTPFFSNAGSDNVKAAISVLNSRNGDMQTRLFVRFGNDRMGPSTAWTALEGGWVTASIGNSSRNTDEKPMGVNKFWAQLGIGVKTTSASKESQATIHVACASVGS